MVKKVFLSLPFSGRTKAEVIEDMEEMKERYLNANRSEAERIQFVTTYYCPKEIDDKAKVSKHPNLVYLGYALETMSQCDDVIFSERWQTARGCQVERLAYDLYFD